MSANMVWIIGLIASVLAAVAGIAETFPAPWDRVLALLGVIGTAITGYMAQRPREAWSEEKRSAVRELKQLETPASDVPPADPPSAPKPPKAA